MEIHFIRHATFILSLGRHKFLVDPMLGPAGIMDPITNTPNPKRNPLVELPFSDETLNDLFEEINAVLVTHTHRDHWDAKAIELLPKNMAIFCQPEDSQKITGAGFSSVHPIDSEIAWEGIDISRTGGQHGTGKLGKMLGPVSGFVLRSKGEPCLYIAGDTIWCPEVEEAIGSHKPDVIVVNAGAAQFLEGDPITMTAEDVVRVCQARVEAKVVPVHMEAINHCLLSRKKLEEELENAGLASQVWIPSDGGREMFTR